MRTTTTTFVAYLNRLMPRIETIPYGLISLLFLLLLTTDIFAQSEDNIRFTQGQVSDSATVSVNVPLGNYKGRGLDLPVSLSYSSTVWNIEYLGKVYPGGTGQSVVEAIFAKNSTSGWKSGLDLPVIEFPKQHDVYNYKGQPGGRCNVYRIKKIFIHMPDGSTHELRKSDSPEIAAVDMTGTFYAVDGSRMRFEANGTSDTGTIYMPDGTRYVLSHPISQIIDRHGNTLTYNESSRQWTDTIGRVIANPLPATPTVGDFPYSLPGLAGVNGGLQTYTFKWRRLTDSRTAGPSGTPALRYVANYYLPNPNAAPSSANMPQPQPNDPNNSFFHAGFSYSNDNGLNQSTYLPTIVVGRGQTGGFLFDPVVLAEIVLPDGTSYKFSYNEYAELDKVIYPTNAYERYEYETAPMEIAGFDAQGNEVPYNRPYDQAKRKVKTRRLSIDGTGNDLLEWQYIETRWPGGPGALGKRMTIIAPDRTRSEIDTWRDPNPEEQTVFGFVDSRVGMVLQRRFFSSSPDGLGGSLLRRELTEYAQSSNNFSVTFTCLANQHTTEIAAGRSPRPVRTVSIVFEGTGPALAQTTTFDYDTTNEFTTGVDQTLGSTYHYVVLDNQTAQTGVIAQIPLGNLAKYSETSYLNDTTYRNANILGLPSVAAIKDSSGNIVSRSEMVYDECPQYCTTAGRALPTSMKTWDSTKGSDPTNLSNQLVTHAKFDGWGNRTQATDAKGYSTTTVYDSTYQAFPVQVISPVPDPTGINGSNTAFTTSTTLDYTTGLPLTANDANGQTTTIEYNDSLLRPTRVIAPNGHQTITEYGAGTSASTRFVKTRSQIDETNWKEGYTWYDGLGRTIKGQSVDSDGDVFVETEYDNMGRAYKVTNPYRDQETIYWSESVFDSAGRPWKTITPDNAFVETTYSIATSGGNIGTAVTVKDQAGKLRRSITNALGHLTRVDEPNGAGVLGSIDTPNQATFYSYDFLNNLTQVQQPGDSEEECGTGSTSCTQTRNFQYDSLSRLKQATNPESGTILYGYDPNGNLTTKTDARTITTTFAYDALNRVKTRQYTNVPQGSETPNVSYFYDNITNAKGKLIKVSSSVSTTEYTSFDILGRVTASKQTTDGVTYGNGSTDSLMTYSYNLSGALIEQQYPSGRKVQNTLDSNGDLEMVRSRKNGSSGYWAYANNFTYNAAGALTSMQLGNGRWESTTFNSRLQPTQIALGVTPGATNLLDLDYTYGTTANNGNVISQTINIPSVGASTGFVAVQTYNYDSLNRLKDATEIVTPTGGSSSQSWRQVFAFDRYGNRNFVTGTGQTTTLGSCPAAVCNPTISPNNNKLTSTGYSFDAAGNTTRDASDRKFTYDAENKQVKVESLSPGTNTVTGTIGEYVYDGDGRRVKKHVPSTGETTVFVYDAGGKLIEEYSTIVASSNDAKVAYLTNDHLGSPRINTDANGAVTARHDYHPFGEEIATSQRTTGLGYAEDTVRKQFTGYERDGETGLDYAKARMFGSGFGRFISPDPLLSSARVEQPQSWNRYAYVLNNPLLFTDPFGLYEWAESAGGSATDDELLARSTNRDLTKNERRMARRQHQFRQRFKAALDYAKTAATSDKLTDEQKQTVQESISSYGNENESNGVKVGARFNTTGARSKATTQLMEDDTVSVNFNFNLKESQFAVTLAHEGRHVADAMNWVYSGHTPGGTTDMDHYGRESRAWNVSSYVGQALNLKTVTAGSDNSGNSYQVWSRGWKAAEIETKRANGVNNILGLMQSPTDRNPYSAEHNHRPPDH